MKLSEAIRLGSLLRLQAYREFFSEESVPKSCALGAAMEAMGKTHEYEVEGRPGVRTVVQTGVEQEVFPIIELFGKHPRFNTSMLVSEVIISLNDDFEWTREQIADWVEEVEKQYDSELPNVRVVAKPQLSSSTP